MQQLLITMKNLLSFIPLLIFLHSSTTAAGRMIDTDLDYLVAGITYYIQPTQSDRGGGLLWYETNTTCKFYAGQVPFDELPGLPVIFSHDKSEVGDGILEYTDLNIRFEYLPGCDDSSTVLQVDKYDEATGQHFITTGGVAGNPGCGTITNWFKIERIPGLYSYKLVFCPTVCDIVNVTCGDVGAFRVGAFPRLVLTSESDYPLQFQFRKAKPCGSNKY